MITYIDTSLVIKLLIDEDGSESAAAIWGSADTLVTVRLLRVETVAALERARRGRRLTNSDFDLALEEFERLWEQPTVVEVTTDLVDRAAVIAVEDGLRGYDAVHLAAALLAGADVMASSDEELCAAAQTRGLHVANPTGTSVLETLHVEGPVVGVVAEWVAAIFDRDNLAEAWPLTEDDLRLALVQSYLVAERSRDVTFDELAEAATALARVEQPAHPWWSDFARWRIRRWQARFHPSVVGRAERGFLSSPQLVGADLEAVLVGEPIGPAKAGQAVSLQRFLVRLSPDGPLVAGIGRFLPRPGWPPGEEGPLDM